MADLAVLGLSSAQEAAYELLISHRRATVADLLPHWPRASSLAEVLDSLVAAGLARESASVYTAVAPRAVFDSLLAADWRRLRDAREYAEVLARDHRAHARVTATDVVEVVTGNVHDRLVRELRTTRRELRRLVRGPAASVAEVERDLIARGVTVRVLCRDAPSPVPPGVRVHESAPVTLYLVDDRLAILPVDEDRYGEPAALMVSPSELHRAMVLLFETLWERAAAPAASETDRLIELLLAGLTDEGIGRALGVSIRTAQRRIADLMTEGGARSRFQAGVQAALRADRNPG
jgi:sugar-specific transcriptional regulator TrmB